MSPAPVIFNSFVIWLMNAIFGRARYRVKFQYKIRHKVLFEFTRTVTVYDKARIDNHRETKVALGDWVKDMPEIKRYLCNGKLFVEPICYLGRWKTI